MRYLAKSVDSARAIYSEMLAEGYIVKAVEMGSGREYEVREGSLVPVRAASGSGGPQVPMTA